MVSGLSSTASSKELLQRSPGGRWICTLVSNAKYATHFHNPNIKKLGMIFARQIKSVRVII